MTQGLFSRGKKVTIPDTFIELPNGAKVAARGFENPENMVGDLNNKNIKAIFNEFLEIDHTEYLTNFTDLLAKEKASMLNLQSITGVVRPIGDNEVISRAFNLARGMVSPTYVGAEFALRIAAGAGIDMIKLAAGNKEASRLMAKMLEFPEKLNKVEISRMSIMIQDFVITELAQMGATIPERFFEYMMGYNLGGAIKKFEKKSNGGKAGGIPKTPKQKKFAALAEPKDRITLADRIKGATT